MNAKNTKYALIAALSILAIGLLGCTGADAASGTPADPERKSVAAPIELVEVVVEQDTAANYAVRIVSGLPAGCAQFEGASVTGRDGNRITVSVTNTMPADPETICTMIYRTHTSHVVLGSDFTPGETYVVDVNGTTVEFTA